MNGGRGRGQKHGGGRFGGRVRLNCGVSGRGRRRGGGNEKFINSVEISDPNRFFAIKEWAKMPGWERREMQ